MSWQDYLTTAEILKKLENYREPVDSYSDLPLEGNKTGDLVLVKSEKRLYTWNGEGWEPIAGGVEGSSGESYWVREGDSLRPRDGLQVYVPRGERAIIGYANYYGVVGCARYQHGVVGYAYYCGVVGYASSYGVVGLACGEYGVVGRADRCGVYGCVNWGFGVVGNAYYCGVVGYAFSDFGVVGNATNYGVYGRASSSYGVYGCAYYCGVAGCAANYGVAGHACFQYGVAGYACYQYGVYGYACYQYGVVGHACFQYGVVGYAPTYGVVGYASSYGVAGYASNYAVYGHVYDQSAVGLGTNGVLEVTSPYRSHIYGELSVGNIPAPKARLDVDGSIATAVLITSSDHTLTRGNSIVLTNAESGSVSIYLPQVSSATGRQYVIKKIDGTTNPVIITAFTGETIEGLEFIQLNSQYESVTLVAGPDTWYRI